MSFSVKKKFVLVQLFVLGYVCANVAYPLLTQRILDQLSGGSFEELKGLFFLLFLSILLLVGCSRGRALSQKRYLNLVKQFYREKILDHIFAKHSEPLSSEQEAEFLSVFNNDIPMVCSDYYQTILSMIYSVVTILFSMTALANINGWIALMVVLNFVLLAVVPMAFKQALQRYKRQISETLKRYNVSLKDSIFCIPVIKSYLAEKEMLCHVNQAGQQANDADYHYAKVQENANLASMLIGYLNDFLVLVIGVYLIINGRMTVGALLAVIQISNIIANPITTLSYHINALHAVMPIKQNLWKMVQDAPRKSTKNKTVAPVQKIRLSDVSVVRDGRAILDHVTLELNAGKRYLLVGKNGCGKSTLLKTINRNITPDAGEIRMDDMLYPQITQESFSQNVLMDYQESYLFTAPVKDNITLYQSYSEKKLQEIGKVLKITHLIEDPDETRVHHLSGGEKQRVALARILLKNPSFYLLDEAFSAMDVDTRQELEQHLLNQKYSIISISHTYTKEILSQYDQIIVMQQGRVLECSPYESLSDRAKENIWLD